MRERETDRKREREKERKRERKKERQNIGKSRFAKNFRSYFLSRSRLSIEITSRQIVSVNLWELDYRELA